MKKLVTGIFIGFFALLALSAIVAQRMYDGPVEDHYYERSLRYFRHEAGAGPPPPSKPLEASAGGQKVLLDISPKPVKAMRELTFSVEIPGYDGPGAAWIDLGMPGMRMPPNRVELVSKRDGRREGTGIVVRCPSGRKAWTATVHIPGKGDAVFTFDVAD